MGAVRGPRMLESIYHRILNVLDKPWVPLIEIALIAVVVYLVLKFIRGTRGATVARGLIIVLLVVSVVAVFLAESFRLPVLSQVLSQVLFWLGVGVIVIFAPEIRRALLRIGQNPFSELFGRERNPMLREVVAAVATLSRDSTGALIAIQRETGLRGYIEGGTRLDAAVTSDLIATIVQQGTALHDGAIILREGRIAAAGCLFPLSENTEKAGHFGTRHRAALGLAEETDAVVVVVSEETGNISLAHDGRIDTKLSLERLTSLLSLLTARRPESRPTTQAILEDLETQPLDDLDEEQEGSG